MTHLVQRLPAPLSHRLSGAASSLYSRQGREYDVALGGIPFMLATIPDTPQTVETIEVRKDQFDIEDPGEQSLSGWWRRSQASFHGGAGVLYAENTVQNEENISFFDSAGIDVFTPGQFQLLKKMKQSSAAGTFSRIRTYASASTGFSAVQGGQLWTSPDADGPFAVMHNPVGKTIEDGLITAGSNFYDVASDGTLYEGLTSAPGSATTWPLTNTAAGAPKRLTWGKHRLWVIGGRNIWQPNLSLAGGSNQAPVYTNPNKGWSYTCMAEGPAAMYFGGNDGTRSSIQAVTLDANGTLPTLSGAAETAILPDGELVQEIAVLGGQYIGIGTNQGFRLGVITNGSITYGPLLIKPAGTLVKCLAMTTQDRFFLVSFDESGNTAAYRVDTSNPVAEGVYPYARDIDAGSSITSMTAAGDSSSGSRLVVTLSNGQVWYQSLTEHVDTGWVQTGRIRFRTTSPKSFRYVELGIEPLSGAIAVSAVDENDSVHPLGSVTAQGEVFSQQLSVQLPPQRHAAIKLTLTPTADKLNSPVVNAVLMLALPAVKPQRLITLPLLCYDSEQSRSGQRYGGSGFANDRLHAVHLYEDAGEPILYQDFGVLDGGRQVVIDSTRFIQMNPAPPNRAGGRGGILIVKLRTVD